jgi:hypothetical protein
MVAINHATVTQATAQTTGFTSFQDVAGTTISSGDLTAGNQYLIIAKASVSGISNSSQYKCRLVNTSGGTTVFTESTCAMEPPQGQTAHGMNWSYMTKWTAVASADIKVQFATASGGGTVTLDSIVVVAIDLDDTTVLPVGSGTDWHYAENTNTVAHGAFYATRETVTLVANGSDEWLVLGCASTNVNNSGASYHAQIATSAGGTPTTPTLTITDPHYRMEGERGGSETRIHSLFRTYVPSAGSHTFALQTGDDGSPRAGTPNDHVYSSLLAINLAHFETTPNDWTAANITVSDAGSGDTVVATSGSFTSATNASTTQDDHILLGFAFGDVAGANRRHELFFDDTVDGVIPAGSDAHTIFGSYSSTDLMPLLTLGVGNFQSGDGARTVELKGNSTATGEAQGNRSLLVWSMEEDAGAPSGITLFPDPVVVPISLPSASLSFGAKTLTPDPVVVPVSLPAPTLSFGTKTLTPDALTVPVVLPNPTVAFGTKTLNVSPVEVPVVLPNVTVQVGGAPTILNPDPVLVPISVPSVTISLGALTLTPDPVEVPIVLPDPTVSLVKTLTPDALAVPIVIPSAQVSLGPLTLTPDALAVPILLPDVTVDVVSGVNYIFSGSDIIEIDTTKFRSGALFIYAAVLAAGAVGQAGRSRLYNITVGQAVTGSEVTYSSATSSDIALFQSSTFDLTTADGGVHAGTNQYRPQHKADNATETCTWYSSKVGVVS